MAHAILSSFSAAPVYRFVINEELSTDQSLLFENMNQISGLNTTLLVGEINDESLLQQTLQTIRALNLPLLSVEMI